MATSPRSPKPRRRQLWRRALIATSALVLLAVVTGFGTTRYLVARAERLHPPAGRFANVENLRQHFLERGTPGAPAVVLVHGAYGACNDFAATVLDDLATRYRCIAWDRPGHGYSERPSEVADPGVQARILLALVDELRLERPLVVGFSYGGAVALAAAVRGGRTLRGVVLLNGPSHPWPDPVDFEHELPAWPIIGPLATATMLTPLAHLLADASTADVFAPEAVAEAFSASPIPLALRPDSLCANAEDIRVLKPFLIAQTPRYRELAVPVSMVVSEADRIVSPTIHSLQLRDAAPDFAMVRIEGAGHQILYTRPEVVITAIDEAMRSE